MHNHGFLGSYGSLIARVFLGAVFIISGIGKAAAFAGTVSFFSAVGLPVAQIFVVLTIITEVGAGLMLVVGWRPRLAAWWLILFVILATLIAHRDIADQNQMTQALKNLAIIGGLLMVALHGAGPKSVGCDCRSGACPDCIAEGKAGKHSQ